MGVKELSCSFTKMRISRARILHNQACKSSKWRPFVEASEAILLERGYRKMGLDEFRAILGPNWWEKRVNQRAKL